MLGATMLSLAKFEEEIDVSKPSIKPGVVYGVLPTFEYIKWNIV